MNILLLSIIIMLIGTFVTSIGQVLLKKSGSKINLTLIVGIIVYLLSMIITIYAFKGGALTILAPITSMTYVWTVLLSLYIFKEHMNKWKWLGLGLIILGIIIITI